MTTALYHDPHIPLLNPALTTLKTSADLGWESILVEHVRLAAGELYVPGLDDLLVCMVLDADYTLEQSRYGHTFVHTFQPGQAQVLPEATTGFWRTRRSVELLHLQFSADFLHTIIGEDHGKPDMQDRFLIDDPKVSHIAYALFAELRDDGFNGAVYADALATALAVHLVRGYGAAQGVDATPPPRITRAELRQAIDYIQAHLADDLSHARLAGLVNLSVSHFDALFRQQFGIAPYQYILQQRVNRAKALLLRSDLTIAQVAAEVGFYDQSHLTRHMRRLLDITPAALRQQSPPSFRETTTIRKTSQAAMT